MYLDRRVAERWRTTATATDSGYWAHIESSEWKRKKSSTVLSIFGKTPNKKSQAKEQFVLHICQTMHGAKVSRLRNLCTRIFGASCNLFCVLPTNRRSKGYDYDFDAIRIQTINLCVLLPICFCQKFGCDISEQKVTSRSRNSRCFCSHYRKPIQNVKRIKTLACHGSHEIYVNIILAEHKTKNGKNASNWIQKKRPTWVEKKK